tara:strand:+ start:143 stop:3838 length:3696 start_codon:yes stop_codon:yes gene_type:complete
LIKRINELLGAHRLRDAINVCSQAIEHSPNFFIYYELMAKALYDLSEYDKASEVIKRGLEVRSDSIILNRLSRQCSTFLNQHSFAGKYDLLPPSICRKLEGGRRIERASQGQSDTKSPLVSVVTVVYNNVSTFERCIRSVLNQTYSNIEYIIIDGGSDKPTIDIIEKYSDRLEYFISEPDNGIYNAMNKGISVAKGDYICLLNSDDVYESKFVELSVNALVETGADISYSDYKAGNTDLKAEKINDGVLLGHLNICHNTFLVSRASYNAIGPYNENLRIISDAVWIRKAFKNRQKFVHVNESLFTLTEGGLSSGATEEHRRLFINEVSQSYVIQFPFLSMNDAEELYLFRFNNKRLQKVLEIAKKFNDQPEFINALRLYVQYCFQSRDNFKLAHTESDALFLLYLDAVEQLGVDLASIRINTKHGMLSDILNDLKLVIEKRKSNSNKVILHFVSVFSTPSETFIYDLLNRLQNKTSHDNFVLFEHERLSRERPFSNKLFVPWNDFRPEVASQIYKYIFDILKPDIIIAHFALNEWKLNNRIAPLGIKVPTLSMTHGIDVFSLKSNPEYKDYIINDFCKRADTHFTCVSDYLYREAISQGIPKNKLTRVYNTANPSFFDCRKNSDFYNYDRELKVLSVGRCIDWKGHTDLIYGFGEFVKKNCSNARLTIVYGNGVDNLSEVKSAISRNNLSGKVDLVPFVNFAEERDFFSKFDIYVQASKYTNDELRKSETFGVAALEAILAGLPVIVTDAGGLPEVVGRDSTYSKIVKHRSGKSIADGLEAFYRNKCTFTDNATYAKERFEYFSENKQLDAIGVEINRLCGRSLNVAMFSTSTIQGAGYAAFRLFRGLRDIASTVNPRMYTTVRNHENEQNLQVVKHPSGNGAGWQYHQKPGNSKPDLTIFTYSHQSISNEQLGDWVKDADVINIHWTARFLSIDNIAYLTNLGKPVVMTIRDMQPITGGCHFFHGCENWKSDCVSCPQLFDNYEQYPLRALAAKRELYNFENLTLVALSNHTKAILEQAPKFRNCHIELIPNSIELDVFKPMEQNQARQLLGLPLDRKIIGYVPSFSSDVKGFKEVTEAFKIINQSSDDDSKPIVMLVGNKTPADDAICLEKKSLGYISDNEKLALAYSAADVIVVPSLEETFSNTTAEAIACGTPVVGFKTGAIPDLAIDGITGFSIEIGDVNALAQALMRALETKFDVKEIRNFATERLDFPLQAKKYEQLFHRLKQS